MHLKNVRSLITQTHSQSPIYRQDRRPLVCVESTATLTVTGRLESWHRLRHANNLSPRPRNLRRLRRVHADTHVSWTVSGCFAVLRQLRSIRRWTSPAVLLVVSLVLDYGNATLAGLPGNQLDRLHDLFALRGCTNTITPLLVTFTGCGCQSG